jgi:hypothetical protein
LNSGAIACCFMRPSHGRLVLVAVAGVAMALFGATPVTAAPATTTTTTLARAVGLSWTSPRAVDESSVGGGTPVAVSCVSAAFCMAVDDGGNAFSYDGAHWASPASVDPGNELSAVSCASNRFCAAVDSNGDAVIYRNGKWAAPKEVDGGAELNSVSCPTVNFCVAVGTQGEAVAYNGSLWKGPITVDAGGDLMAVSCPSATFCAAVNLATDNTDPAGPSAVIFRRGTWVHGSAMPAGFAEGEALSCANKDFCVAVDDSGDAAIFNGVGWGREGPVDPTAPGVQTSAVSCPSTGFCAAVDSSGQVIGYDGSSWAAPATIAKGAPLNAVSCPTSSFCAAGGDAGSVMTGS